jgi:hypothetical protein
MRKSHEVERQDTRNEVDFCEGVQCMNLEHHCHAETEFGLMLAGVLQEPQRGHASDAH